MLPTLPKGSNPCQNCTRRKLGCHDKCPDYKIFKEKVAELRKKQRGYNLVRSTKTAEISSKYSVNKNRTKSIAKLIDKVNREVK